ncbi:spore coat protein U-like protein [Serratia fonticola]|jgi:spore coat protein U-like protein|uniref:Spore coat protein U-like protein n=1 Tax=Serratia fonticola TaxID=47917 RepID=A0A542BNZ0_SERFO|nr:spore coat protein U domain-containing protein [Serratia fonticola]TQI80302.1 spore coat protein U-like protein [Serratia fonticola]TQI97671.1 spore coat protein U-like protein [Serratia fonticola]TVZ72169.1 spore coat protein U-like protein [Serratia fonticola]
MKKYGFIAGAGLVLCMVNPVLAGTTTGTISASLVLTAGCVVNGGTGTSGLNLGTLNFGTYNAQTFTGATATLASTPDNAIAVKCSPGSTYTIKVTGSNAVPSGAVYGTVPTTGPRYLVGTTNTTQGVAYLLSLSSSFAPAGTIVNGTAFPAATTTDPTYGDLYPIYGQITGVTNNENIRADTYADNIQVEIDY